MALNARATRTVQRLTRFVLVSGDVARLADFYERAFCCRRLDTRYLNGPAFERLLDVSGGALSITLALGNEIVELLEFDRPGHPYPETSSSDLTFQHLAIVVRNVDAAYARLSRLQRWAPISLHGPERLPEASGGVAAFKFRDPEGHPLELLAFPEARLPTNWQQRDRNELWLGIDHSAISVADTDKSVAFYEGLGLRVASRTINRGKAQAGLDALCEPQVEVTALRPPHIWPHVELLCYWPPAPDPAMSTASNDISATRLVFQCSGPSRDRQHDRVGTSECDPDGHRLLLLAPPN